MEIILKNEHLTATIDSKGAELKSLYKGTNNVIWDVDTLFWDKTSPVLFPIVGCLKGDTYFYNGGSYTLPRHGFARDMEFAIIESTGDSATFLLSHNEDTLKVYPFKFTLSICYQLIEDQLVVKYLVGNDSAKTMYFSLGAHPAFAVRGNFEDYNLVFDAPGTLETHKIEDGLFSGRTEQIPLQGKVLPLRYSLFEKDAIVLKHHETASLTLKKENIPIFKVDFQDFPYLGIWTQQNAHFICIEPWAGLADSVNATGNLEEKEGIIALEGLCKREFRWSVEIY